MALKIEQYSGEHIGAVREFNARLHGWGVTPDFLLPATPTPAWLPKCPNSTAFNEIYLALDEAVIRGAYTLKHEQFSFAGKLRWVGCVHHPYSEGVIHNEYVLVGPQMYRHAGRIEPMLYALGMDGIDQPLPRMLKRMKWPSMLLPFQVKIVHPNRFLRCLPKLQRGKLGLISKILRFTGSASAGFPLLHYLRALPGRERGVSFDVVDHFSNWAEDIWRDCQSVYTVLPLRNQEVLNLFYPAGHLRFTRIRVKRDSRTIGWAVVGELHNPTSKNFGDLHVGALLDGLTRPEHVQAVVNAATAVLESRRVDLIISNHSHAAWVSAIRNAGYLRFPSTFVCSAAPETAKHLAPMEEALGATHFNRSGADGLYKYEYPFSASLDSLWAASPPSA